MAADSRSTHTDALATLGMIHTKLEARDAIHLGVEPVIAGEELEPGEHIGLAPDGTAWASLKHIGIVDPFLSMPVKKGQRFWLIVYPRQITSLRHVWEHPDFPASGETGGTQLLKETKETAPATEEQIHQAKLLIQEPVAMAKEHIRGIAKGLDISEGELMDAAASYVRYGEYLVDGGKFEGESIPDSFWPAYELVTGTKVSNNKRGSFLSCPC